MTRQQRSPAALLLYTPLPAQALGGAQPFTDGHKAGLGVPEVSGSRMAIAAAAQAAAAAAGLPDPAAVDDEPLSPMDIDEPVDGAPALTAAAGDEDAAAAAIGESDSPATAAMAAAVAALKPTGSSGVEAGVLHQVLSALQRQMQKLVTLEERCSVDIVRLNAKVGEHRVHFSQPKSPANRRSHGCNQRLAPLQRSF